ncbi:MAG TPA: prenyltransferase/squalene oxidase repeat-containing protein [Verrucomicrobiae bacterium]|nr:prenyltransferase/squalene oxidase repeat-containing protein [Verrucomicrobiae bacterium]
MDQSIKVFFLIPKKTVAISCWMFVALLIASSSPAQAAGNPSLRHEIERAIDRGVELLIKIQSPEGRWSTADQPAVSSLVLVALQGQKIDGQEKAAISKGYEFLRRNIQPDGSIHGGKGLVNYNTSLGLLALAAAKDPRDRDDILRARHYLIGTQIDQGIKGETDTPFDGGVGYGSKYEHSDMGNTLQALEALYYTRQYAADSTIKEDLNWEAAIHFLQSCQNLPSHNKESWASDDPVNKGGFIYYPGNSMAGETNLPSGRVALRSYGSISYAGLLSFIYADLKKEDPRVQAVLDWLQKNYTLEENPGMGPQGLYYYFQTMTKALNACGVEQFATPAGVVNWREKLALRLLDLQQPDGSWINDNARWWEKDKALVTAYGLITLETIARGL